MKAFFTKSFFSENFPTNIIGKKIFLDDLGIVISKLFLLDSSRFMSKISGHPHFKKSIIATAFMQMLGERL